MSRRPDSVCINISQLRLNPKFFLKGESKTFVHGHDNLSNFAAPSCLDWSPECKWWKFEKVALYSAEHKCSVSHFSFVGLKCTYQTN